VGAGIATYLFLTSGASHAKEKASAAHRLRLAPQLAGDRVGLAASASW